MELMVYDEWRRPYLSVWVGVALALLAAVLGAGTVLAFRASAAAGPGRPPPAATCLRAVEQADAAIAAAVPIETALSKQTDAMNGLLAGRLTTRQALDRTLPGLTRGAEKTVQFDTERGSFADLAASCRAG